ncbi:MAG: hypothetical protein MZV70_16995 [Desulfobacterales bacterium]|nr:hypothetical protein [Desulfobacterales bacterium]
MLAVFLTLFIALPWMVSVMVSR